MSVNEHFAINASNAVAGRKRHFGGPDGDEFKRVDTAGSSTATTLYLGSVEKVHYHDGTIYWKRNIGGVALITQTVNSGGTVLNENKNYLLKDHLDSISLITNGLGNVVEEMYYDPWGARRDILGSSASHIEILSKPTTVRGFTGHEMLDETGLIHMNGRIYDPRIARFVQADPIVQDPYHSQSLNRYSYVWNNPLNAIDPSGFTGLCSGSYGTMVPCQTDRSYNDGRDNMTRGHISQLDSMMRNSYVSVELDGHSVESFGSAGSILLDMAFTSIAMWRPGDGMLGRTASTGTVTVGPDMQQTSVTVNNQNGNNTLSATQTQNGKNAAPSGLRGGATEEVVVRGERGSRGLPGFGISSRFGPRDIRFDSDNARYSELQSLQVYPGSTGMQPFSQEQLNDAQLGPLGVALVPVVVAGVIVEGGPIAVAAVRANKDAVRKAVCAAGFLAACGQGRLHELDKIGDDLRMLEQMRRLNQTRQQTTHSPK